jgi:hypothetical protein
MQCLLQIKLLFRAGTEPVSGKQIQSAFDHSTGGPGCEFQILQPKSFPVIKRALDMPAHVLY